MQSYTDILLCETKQEPEPEQIFQCIEGTSTTE